MPSTRACAVLGAIAAAIPMPDSLQTRHFAPSQPPACAASASQHGEEDRLVAHFEGWARSPGTYVEIGALDGAQFSNTLRLATCAGWSGVLVEGAWDNYERLERNVLAQRRPNVTAHFGAVCAPPQRSVRFAQGQKLRTIGGDVDAMAEGYREKWGRHQRAPVDVACAPMSHYLRGVPHVHFFSLDVEGAELVVLETIDFTATTVDVFLIEMDEHDPAKNWKIRTLMRNLGYTACARLHVDRSVIFRHARTAPC